jgi:hypothetical protein
MPNNIVLTSRENDKFLHLKNNSRQVLASQKYFMRSSHIPRIHCGKLLHQRIAYIHYLNSGAEWNIV